MLSLALGIGANVAIFNLVNALMLKALPLHEPERLVVLQLPPNRGGTAAAAPRSPIRSGNTCAITRTSSAACSRPARRALQPERRRRSAAGRRHVRERPLLRRARRDADHRPHVHRRRRSARRRQGRTGRGAEPRVLAARVRRRSRRPRPARSISTAMRSRSSASRRRSSSASKSAAPSTSPCRSAPSRSSAAPRARSISAARGGCGCSRASRRVRPSSRPNARLAAFHPVAARGHDAAGLAAAGSEELPRAAPDGRPRRHRHLGAPHSLQPAALRPARHRRAGAARRVRQHGQSAARAVDGAAARDRDPAVARRVALAWSRASCSIESLLLSFIGAGGGRAARVLGQPRARAT